MISNILEAGAVGLCHGHGLSAAGKGGTELVKGLRGNRAQGHESERVGVDVVGDVGRVSNSQTLSCNVAGD